MSEISDATATDVTTVDEKIVRNTVMPRSCWCASTARPRPSAMPIGTVSSTNSSVTFKLFVNAVRGQHVVVLRDADAARGRFGNGGVR